jgi:hypothetical protein
VDLPVNYLVLVLHADPDHILQYYHTLSAGDHHHPMQHYVHHLAHLLHHDLKLFVELNQNHFCLAVVRNTHIN